MKCNNCGYELVENDMFCPKCGTQIQRNGDVNEMPPREEMYNYDRQQVNPYIDNNQNYGQTNNYGQQYGNNGGNVIKTCVAIVITVAILAAIGIGVYFGISSINKKNNVNTLEFPGGLSNTTPQTTTTPSSINETPTQITNQQNTSTYKVNFEGFNLYIPDNLIYKIESTNSTIKIGDSLYTWLVQLRILEGNFDQLKANIGKIKGIILENLAVSGATVSDAKIEYIDGIEYITVEASAAGENIIMAYAELNSMYTALIIVQNDKNEFDRNALRNITSTIKNAEFTGVTKKLEIKSKIKIEDINKAIKKILK